MLKRIQTFEDGRIPAKKARNWEIEGQNLKNNKGRVQEIVEGVRNGRGFMAQKGRWNVAKKKMLQGRGALLEEEGDIVREYKAMHGEKFLSSWLREDVERLEERRKNR